MPVEPLKGPVEKRQKTEKKDPGPDVKLCFGALQGRWVMGQEPDRKRVQGIHDPDCAEPGTVFSSL